MILFVDKLWKLSTLEKNVFSIADHNELVLSEKFYSLWRLQLKPQKTRCLAPCSRKSCAEHSSKLCTLSSSTVTSIYVSEHCEMFNSIRRIYSSGKQGRLQKLMCSKGFKCSNVSKLEISLMSPSLCVKCLESKDITIQA